MSMLLDPNWQRGYLVPYGRDKRTGQGGFAVPGVVHDMLSAMMLPGDVYQGNVLLNDPQTGRTSDEVIRRSADLAGLLTLGSGAIPAEANSLRMGIKAYHGSPHDFDRFDMSKIGTGEGAQAYGHGLYFAQDERVAQAYRDALKRKGDEIAFDGQPLKGPGDYNAIQSKLENQEGDWRAFKALDEITRRQGSMEERLADIRNWYRDQPEMLAAINRVESRTSLDANPGRMYEVNIDADPNDFLDLNRPITEQSPAVQSSVQNLNRYSVAPVGKVWEVRHPGGWVPNQAKSYYRSQEAAEKAAAQFNAERTPMDMVPKNAAAMEELRKAGVPGIQYYDAMSRTAAEGTRNYVVFDDKLISIVKKYGVAALVSAGVLSQAQGEEMKAQGYY